MRDASSKSPARPASRGGVRVDLQWDMTAGASHAGQVHAELTSRTAQTVTIKFPFAPAEIACDGGDLTPSPLGDAYCQLDLQARQPVVVKASK